MSSFNLLNIGVQSLTANQAALGVVGQNIANVNTPGYSRQIPNFISRDTPFGVEVTNIQRIADDFLTRQYWSDNSTFNKAQVYTEFANRLDDLLASNTTSVSTAMDNFFLAMQNAVDDPTSLPNRELMIAEANALTRRFNDLGSSLARQNLTLNDQLSIFSQEVSSLSSNIADLNNKIRLAVAANKPANELRDQRDQLVDQLSGYLDITVVDQGAGEYSIFVGNGQPLVVGMNANTLAVKMGDPDNTQPGIAVVIAGRVTEVTNQISGGKIGGLFEFREKMLNPAINELGRIALAFQDSMNQVHREGMDLDGRLGDRFFTDINTSTAMQQRVSAKSTNSSSLESAGVRITDASKLPAFDFNIVFSNAEHFTLVRDDGRNLSSAQMQTVSSPDQVVDGSVYRDATSGKVIIGYQGMQITLDTRSGFFPNDTFRIQPNRNAAENIGVSLTNGRQLALASPIRISGAPDNTGTGVASVEITNISAKAFSDSGVLKPPVQILFNNSQQMTYTLYDISNPSQPKVLDLGLGPLENQLFKAGQPIQLDGYSLKIVNQPAPGDRFSLSYNTDGVSDNRNALRLSDLQQKKLIDGGSYQDAYGSLVSSVGTRTSVAQINLEANRSVREATANAKASVSGVNMDEEAARLVQFQQAYQASSQLIRASQTIFDSLLAAI